MISNHNFLLYAAYTSTCLEDRAWSFFVTIVLESIGGMFFVSIGQFSESSLQMILGGVLGQFIDKICRKKAVIMVIFFNNFSILLQVILLVVCKSENQVPALLHLAIFYGAINRLFLNAEKSIIARDWVVALNDKSELSRQNAILTGFDQMLNILSPIAVGTLLTKFGMHHTLIVFGVFSMLSLFSKLTFLSLTYNQNVTLQNRQEGYYSLPISDEEPLFKPSKPRGVISTYWKQTTFCAAFGMALFYKTVMGFDNLAVGYATNASDLSVFTIGALKSYAVLCRMAGVISYAFLEKRIGIVYSGYVGLAVQQIFSLLAVLTIWMPGSPMDFTGNKPETIGPSVLIFPIAIATSRFGLWCLDMAVTHSMQIHVPETERNTVFGFHMALCQTFSVPKEMLVIMFPQASHFALYIISSYLCVVLGQFFFYLYAKNINE